MSAVSITPEAVAVLALGAGAILYLATRPGAAAAIGSGAVSAAADLGGGVVLGIGDVVGIPRTDTDQCSQDLAAGRTWDASFSCPASRFIAEGLFGGGSTPAPDPWGREVREPLPPFTGGASGGW